MTILDYVYIIGLVAVVVPLGVYTRAFFQEHKNKFYAVFYKNYDRDLSAKDITFIEQKTNSLLKYFSAQQYNARFYINLVLLYISIFVVWFLPSFLITMLEDTLTTLARPVPQVNSTWYETSEAAYSIIFALFLGMVLGHIIFIALAQGKSRLLSHSLYANSVAFEERNNSITRSSIIEADVSHLLRSGRVLATDDLAPKELARIIFNRLNRVTISAFVLFFMLTAAFLFFDVYTYTRISKNTIEYRPYFSFTSYEYDFSDVEVIDRECKIYLKRGDVKAALQYKIQLNDGRKILLIKGEGNWRQLSAALFIHQYTNANRSAVRYTADYGRKSQANHETCLRLLTQDRSSKNARRIKMLLT